MKEQILLNKYLLSIFWNLWAVKYINLNNNLPFRMKNAFA